MGYVPLFTSELDKAPQGNMHLLLNKKQVTAGYEASEALFALEFTDFMGESGEPPEEEYHSNDTN